MHFDGIKRTETNHDELAGMLESCSINGNGAEGGRRYYCPVPGCLKGGHRNAAGWSSLLGVRGHVEEHLAGRLQGMPPEGWLSANNLDICAVCSKTISKRYQGTCPKCRPAQREHQGNRTAQGRPMPENAPSWAEVAGTRMPTKAYVPKCARQLWAQCVIGAMEQIEQHGDERAWYELYLLPKAVLKSSGRGGAKAGGKRRAGQETQERARRWLAGARVELWEPGEKQRLRKRQARKEKEEGTKGGKQAKIKERSSKEKEGPGQSSWQRKAS